MGSSPVISLPAVLNWFLVLEPCAVLPTPCCDVQVLGHFSEYVHFSQMALMCIQVPLLRLQLLPCGGAFQPGP